MVRLGRYFKAPPKRAIRQWHKVELLFHYGERFESGNSRLGTKVCIRSANCMLSLAGLDAMLWFSFGETGDGEMGAECREGIVLA